MDYVDVVLSSVAALAMASVACLDIVKTNKEETRVRVRVSTTDFDVAAMVAITTFVAMMLAQHPEWAF